MASLVGGAGVTGALEAIEEMRDEVEVDMWILARCGFDEVDDLSNFHVYFSKVSTYSYVESVHGNSLAHIRPSSESPEGPCVRSTLIRANESNGQLPYPYNE